MEAGDDPGFVRRLFTWVKRHQRCQMLVYYQDFGSTSPYRIQNYPASLEVLKAELHSPLFPSFAKGAPHRPPPPPRPRPGGVRPLATRHQRSRRRRARRSSPAPPCAAPRRADSAGVIGCRAVMLE